MVPILQLPDEQLQMLRREKMGENDVTICFGLACYTDVS